VEGLELEMGNFLPRGLEEYKGNLGIRIERDLYFRPTSVKEVWDRRDEHV